MIIGVSHQAQPRIGVDFSDRLHRTGFLSMKKNRDHGGVAHVMNLFDGEEVIPRDRFVLEDRSYSIAVHAPSS